MSQKQFSALRFNMVMASADNFQASRTVQKHQTIKGFLCYFNGQYSPGHIFPWGFAFLSANRRHKPLTLVPVHILGIKSLQIIPTVAFIKYRNWGCNPEVEKLGIMSKYISSIYGTTTRNDLAYEQWCFFCFVSWIIFTDLNSETCNSNKILSQWEIKSD